MTVFLRNEAIAAAADRLEARGAGAELPAQAVEAALERVSRALASSPHRLVDVRRGVDDAGAAQEDGEDLGLLGLEVLDASVHEETALCEIELQAGPADQGGLVLRPVEAHGGEQARAEHLRRAGLGQVVVGSAPQAGDDLVIGLASAEDQHREVPRLLIRAYGAQEVHPVAVAESAVEDHGVEARAGELATRGGQGEGRDGGEGGGGDAGKPETDQVVVGRIVIDHEDLQSRRGGHALSVGTPRGPVNPTNEVTKAFAG